MKYYTLIRRILMYMTVFGLAALIAGCSQGPVTNEEADQLRSELTEMSDQLAQVRSDLDTLIQAIEDRDMERQVADMRDRLGSMMTSLADVEEALKPEEPETPPGQAPAGGMGGGGAGGAPGGGAY